ncbi:MAG: alpha/beta hydrolase [Spirochaetes bacterium]|nr:alpha/beta hydrolase [Spirochaetota bacterium]
MITVENIMIRNNRGMLLPGRIYSASAAGNTGVIFSHGLFSSKDGYKITRLAEHIASAGCPLMTFDFSFAGESGENISGLSILQETEDLAAAIDFFRSRGVRKFHLMGSSMGAAVTILCASRHHEDVLSLILIAAPVDLRRLILSAAGIQGIEDLAPNGTTALDGIAIKNTFFREILSIDMIGAVRSIKAPVLAFHGELDRVVDPLNVALLEENLSVPLKKIIIGDGDHNLTRDSDIALFSHAILAWLNGVHESAGGTVSC